MPDRRGGRSLPALLPWLLPLLALALAAPALWRSTPLAGSPAAEEAARRALAQGNLLVRDGSLDEAVAAYLGGWQGGAAGGAADLAGVLAYNLGTTLHRLDRRPEALIWYRRAQRLRPGDPWLADNLALVRTELAAPRHPPPGFAERLASRRAPLLAAAVAAAWLSLVLLALRRPIERRRPDRRWPARALNVGALGVGMLAIALWTIPALAQRLGPRPAVLLDDCGEVEGGEVRFAAGSEVWVRRAGGVVESEWEVVGGGVCSAAAVGVVDAVNGDDDSGSR